MTKRLSMIWLLAVAACGAPSRTSPPAAAVSAEDTALGQRVDAAITAVVAAQRTVGVVVLIARDGNVIYQRATGHADREAKTPVTVDTIFRLASMTKPIVSVVALALVDQGALRLDDPVTKWLPEFRPKLVDGRDAVITVRHLITHTSGLGYRFMQAPEGSYHQAEVSDGLAEPGLAFAENARRLASVPLLFEPGTQWHYGLSIDVLGEVVARAGGGTLDQVVQRTISEPLGLRDLAFTVTASDRLAAPYGSTTPPTRMTEPYAETAYGMTIPFAPSRILDPASYHSGGAGAASTAHDYLRFVEAIRTGGAPILAAETARAMTQNQIGTLAPIQGPGWNFGYGVGVVADPAAAKSTQGVGSWSWAGVYGTYFWVDPAARLSVIVMTNVVGLTLPVAIEQAVYAR